MGEGHLYQGRFKSFPVQEDEHFYQVMRYVERNAQRAEIVNRAEKWCLGSRWRRLHGNREQREVRGPLPVGKPRKWAELVNQPQHETEVNALRKCIARGQPYGSDSWVLATLGLEFTLRPRGWPESPKTRNKSAIYFVYSLTKYVPVPFSSLSSRAGSTALTGGPTE